MTLAKGPGFPLFLAVNAALGVSAILSAALIYAAACWALIRSLRRVGLGEYLCLAIFVVALFHPQVIPTRIIREDIYPALSLLVLAAAIRVLEFRALRDGLLGLAPYGLAIGWFWITREEGIWVVPGLTVLVVLKLLQLRSKRTSPLGFALGVGFTAAIACMPVLFVSLVNLEAYGKFAVVDFTGSEFSRTLKLLNGVERGLDKPYVGVSAAKRRKLYEVSPSFAQLAGYFEQDGRGWVDIGCRAWPQTCGEYANGLFPWALRDGVSTKGYYADPVRADNFYAQINKEILAACETKMVQCAFSPIPFIPNLSTQQVAQLPRKFVDGLWLAMSKHDPPLTEGDSWDPLNRLQQVREFLGFPRSTPSPSEKVKSLEGWYHSPIRDWLDVECSRDGVVSRNAVARLASPDVAQYFGDSGADRERFSLSVPDTENCRLVSQGNPSADVRISDTLPARRVDLGKGFLVIESISSVKGIEQSQLALEVKKWLSEVYRNVIPWLLLAGVLAYFVQIGRVAIGMDGMSNLMIAATTAWVMLLSRLSLLALIDVSAFSALNYLYAGPCFPILCVASILSLGALIGSTASSRRAVI